MYTRRDASPTATYHGGSGLPLEMQSGGPSESTASAMTSYNIITVHQARFSELSKRKQHSSLRRGLALAAAGRGRRWLEALRRV